MPFVLKDRVKDTTTTTGTGNITISGSTQGGFRTFNDVLSSGDTTFYAIKHQIKGEWEVGVATYSGSNVLARTSVLDSSNSGSAVDFSTGTKDVWMDLPAAKIYCAGGPDVAVEDGGTGASNAAGARTNLGLGTAATANAGAFATAAQGALADSALQASNNLSDLANAEMARSNLGIALPRSYLAGLGLSNNATAPDTKLDVAAGECRSVDNSADIKLASGVTIDFSTTGVNAIDTDSIAASTWYHVYAIAKADGTSAALASTSASDPTLPDGYTVKRRIGSVLTDASSHIIAFTQTGDLFDWSSYVVDISATNPGTSAVLRTLTVPTGIKVQAILMVALFSGSGSTCRALINDPANADGAVSISNQTVSMSTVATGSQVGGQVFCMTNTSAQVRSRLSDSTSTTVLTIDTIGWIDRRGRDD